MSPYDPLPRRRDLAWRLLTLMCVADQPPHEGHVSDLMITLCDMTGMDVDDLATRLLDWGVANNFRVHHAISRRLSLGSDAVERVRIGLSDRYALWGECTEYVDDKNKSGR